MSPTNQTVPESGIRADGESSNLPLKTEGQKGMMRWKHNRKQVRFPQDQPDPTSDRSSLSNMAAGRFSSPGRTTRCMSATSFLTTLWMRARSALASVLKPSPAPCATSFRNDGFGRRRLMNAKNPKRVYYLSMEFLIGRSLANNVTNLLLDDDCEAKPSSEKKLDWFELLEQEPDAGLGNGGLGRLAACFLDSMATMEIPAMGYGLRYEYGIFKQTIQDGWQHEVPDNWLRRPDPWEVRRPHETVEIHSTARSRCEAGACAPSPASRPALIGIPFDRPVVGYGGKTINTLRLWAAAAHDYFNFQEFSSGDFVGALAETLEAESMTRVLYPDDSYEQGTGIALCAGIFSRRLLAG